MDLDEAEIEHWYHALAQYARHHDVRLRGFQTEVGKIYDPLGPTNFDLMALMGWAMYMLREAGVPPQLVLSVLAYQARELDLADQVNHG
jgi:hypothetical protein